MPKAVKLERAGAGVGTQTADPRAVSPQTQTRPDPETGNQTLAPTKDLEAPER